VVPKSPAEQGGIRKGDLVTAVNGVPQPSSATRSVSLPWANGLSWRSSVTACRRSFRSASGPPMRVPLIVQAEPGDAAQIVG
jgi:hypothetical protein